MSLTVALSIALAGRGVTAPGAVWDIRSSDGTSYVVSQPVLDSSGTAYVVVPQVLSSDGTSYVPV